MEIILKRQPYDGANQGGWHDGTTLLEAYELDGTFYGRLIWELIFGQALIIPHLSFMILMEMVSVRLLSVRLKVLVSEMENKLLMLQGK